MSPNENLQLFARQLASWSEQIIENGRTPFRRVDLFRPLHTSVGTCRPPLIFWINRQSMIAGGLIFLPDATSDPSYNKEADAATALGLRHFVTWEASQINVWEVSSGENLLVTSLPLGKADDPAIFHHRLSELIDQLKLLSITGRIDAKEISPFYLLNLLEETLELAFPALLEQCRLQRSETASILAAEDEAESWNRLTMLRILCLFNWQLMPSSLSVNKLSSSTKKLLTLLPEPLAQALQNFTPGPAETLPGTSAVAFHHLILRLQQIGWQGRSNHGEKVLRLLLNLWHGKAKLNNRSQNQERLLLHSRELAPDCHHEVSHSGAQLAANTLWRVLDKSPHPTQMQGDTFKFSAEFQQKNLHANFYGTMRPEPALRRELAGHLRTSWPNRHLLIPGNLPFWTIEAAHMLGLSAQNSRIELHLSANWLKLLGGTVFSDLLFSNFALETVDCRETSRHLLHLSRRQNEGLTECLLPDGNCRKLELGQNHHRAVNRLLYTLELPPLLFELFNQQQLLPLTDTAEEAYLPEALAYYAKSSMGQQLWRLCTDTKLPSTTAKLLKEGSEHGWLVPETSSLKELVHLIAQKKSANSEAYLDDILTQLLGIPSGTPIEQTMATGDTSVVKPVSRDLGEQLLRQLEAEGIPYFPQTYLYRQATGPLNSYSFTPPLKVCQELLGQYELEDARNQQFQVVGEETKDALLLASSLNLKSLEIPQNRQQTADMLDSYRQDLRKLQEKISRLCHRHIEQPAAAQRLQKKLWQQLPLPSAKWLSS